MSQTVYLKAGVYDLSRSQAAQRFNYQTQDQVLEVLVDGAEVGAVVSRKHRLWFVPIVEFHGYDGHAHRRGPRFESGGRRQHGLHRPSHDRTGRRLADRWEFRAAAPGRQYLATDPNGLAWQFSGTAGVAGNGSGFVLNRP